MSHNGLYPTPMAFDMALQPVSQYMLNHGFRIDTKLREEMRVEHIESLYKLYEQLNTVVGYKLKAKKSISDDKVKKWLYGDMKVKARTKQKKVTSDENALRAVMADEEQEIKQLKQQEAKERHLVIYLGIKIILRIKAKEKELHDYIEMDLDQEPNNIQRARTVCVVGGAETARFAHTATPWGTGYNLATVPHKLRNLFIADDGYEIAEFDLNRGESWIYAHLSGDPELIRIHANGDDFHSETASALTSDPAFSKRQYTTEEIIKLNEEDDNFGYMIRYVAKRVNHATAYLMGPFTGAEAVNKEADDTGITITPSQMKRAQNIWKEKYLGMQNWWDWTKAKINKDRTLETPYGRKRVFYGFLPSDKVYKESLAYIPQSTSVDYINLGMLKVFNDLVLKDFCGLQLLHQNHDSIIVQYKQNHRNEVIPTIIEKLSSTIRVNKYTISIPMEAKYGQNWLKLTKFKG